MLSWRKAVVPIEAAHCTPASLERARRVSDLVAWAGGGALEARRIQELIAPEADAPRSYGLSLLIRQASGGKFLVTTCHLLRTPTQTDLQPQELLAPDHFWAAPFDQEEASRAAASITVATPSQAQLKFVASLPYDFNQQGWFPATSFPHLDLAVVRIDAHGGHLCSALEEAGYKFLPANLLADGPSGEGAKVLAIEVESSCPGDSPAEKPITLGCEGHVTSLRKSLSFFWTDIPISRTSVGCPIIESDRIVGIVTPQVTPVADYNTQGQGSISPLYTVAKAVYVKALLQSHFVNAVN